MRLPSTTESTQKGRNASCPLSPTSESRATQAHRQRRTTSRGKHPQPPPPPPATTTGTTTPIQHRCPKPGATCSSALLPWLQTWTSAPRMPAATRPPGTRSLSRASSSTTGDQKSTGALKLGLSFYLGGRGLNACGLVRPCLCAPVFVPAWRFHATLALHCGPAFEFSIKFAPCSQHQRAAGWIDTSLLALGSKRQGRRAVRVAVLQWQGARSCTGGVCKRATAPAVPVVKASSFPSHTRPLFSSAADGGRPHGGCI